MTKHKYNDKQLKQAVIKSASFVGVLRELGYTKIAGGNATNLKNKLIKKDIDFSHFTGQGHRKGKPALRRKTPEQILILKERDTRPSGRILRRALKEIGVNNECAKCACSGTWQDEPITLHVDHINGSWSDNRQSNLRFLCPNCHSQTKTFGNKSR